MAAEAQEAGNAAAVAAAAEEVAAALRGGTDHAWLAMRAERRRWAGLAAVQTPGGTMALKPCVGMCFYGVVTCCFSVVASTVPQ